MYLSNLFPSLLFPFPSTSVLPSPPSSPFLPHSYLPLPLPSSLQVSKGWFNLEETSFEAYQGSKLRKLMELIKFAMQVRESAQILTQLCKSYDRACSAHSI